MTDLLIEQDVMGHPFHCYVIKELGDDIVPGPGHDCLCNLDNISLAMGDCLVDSIRLRRHTRPDPIRRMGLLERFIRWCRL